MLKSLHPFTQASMALVLASMPALGTLQWTQEPGYRVAAVKPDTAAKVGFTLLQPQSTGIHFTNVIPSERHYTNQVLLNGSGVAAGDVDGDGWCDLFFCGLGGGSALYRNLGDWKFQKTSFALSKFDATGAAFADLDGDADLDLLINSAGQGTRLFLNDGKGNFMASPILNENRCGSSLAIADIDDDGDLDVYIANYRTSTIRDQPGARFTINTVNGQPVPAAFGGRPLTDPDLTNRFAFRFKPAPGGGGSVLHDELGEADVLYRNEGGGRFVPVPFTGPTFLDEEGKPLLQPPFDWGLSVMMRDFNHDGAPDIYVCNDFTTPDRFWINDGQGRFRATSADTLRQTSLSTMAIDAADINRDGFDDLFTADMLSRERWRRLVQRNEANPNIHLFVDVARRPQSPRNVLQLARGDGTYAEVAQLAGLEAAEWAWASIFLDVDLDGYEDLLVANGFERDYMNMDAHRKVTALQAQAARQMPMSEQLRLNRHYPRLATANLAFRNLGNLRFAETSAQWGFDQQAVSQGMCLADLDNDGDLDAAINNSNDDATLLRNDTPAPRVAVRLKGKAPNTHGIGAKIKVLNGAVPTQTQEMISGGRYLSSDDSMRVFAVGPLSPTSSPTLSNQMTIEVIWRSGARSMIANVLPNHIYEIEQVQAEKVGDKVSDKVPPIFKDISGLLAHRHEQNSFDDFARQPLLPHKLSSLGPGVSWFDVDADGWDDLIIAGGKGAAMAVYRNDKGKGFARFGDLQGQRLARAQTTVLGWRSEDGATLLAGSSNYEDGLTNGSVLRQYRVSPQSIDENLPGSIASTGPLALADLNGDGQLELFVGGRVIPGRWPEAAPSLLFRQADGKWVIDQENTKQLFNVGLVSGAVFSDLDNDGDPELVLGCEWGPVKIFRNDNGRLDVWPAPVKALNSQLSTLNQLTGWWNGVSAGDFDGDGRMDLIASNYGRNTKHERSSPSSKPLRLYYGDFNGDGGVAVIESWYDEALRGYAPILNVWTMSRSMPWLLERFGSYEAFSRATVEKVLGDRGRAAKYLEAAWLDTMVFLNRGEHFEVHSLPVEAQFAPAFAICVADFDGDGHEDAFLSQNFFGTRTETSRYDAGRGLLLRGNGRGGFGPVAGEESGLLIYGEQRGAAAGDFDADGRTDLVVTQVGTETKLLRNETARPGLRVRLAGPKGNPHGVGAVIRLQRRDTLGPAREIHAGSGYWSQDSAVQVMSTASEPATAIQVRWPGGKVVEAQLPSGALEVSIDLNSQVKRIR